MNTTHLKTPNGKYTTREALDFIAQAYGWRLHRTTLYNHCRTFNLAVEKAGNTLYFSHKAVGHYVDRRQERERRVAERQATRP